MCSAQDNIKVPKDLVFEALFCLEKHSIPLIITIYLAAGNKENNK
jgi:hypothetical protein